MLSLCLKVQQRKVHHPLFLAEVQTHVSFGRYLSTCFSLNKCTHRSLLLNLSRSKTPTGVTLFFYCGCGPCEYETHAELSAVNGSVAFWLCSRAWLLIIHQGLLKSPLAGTAVCSLSGISCSHTCSGCNMCSKLCVVF
jgi:hypothetical protein